MEKTLYHYDSYTNENSIVRFRNDNHIHSGLIFVNTFAPILSDKKYEHAWYLRKTIVKRWIFRVPNSRFPFVETLPEINKRYISENKKKSIKSEEYCITLCLLGHEKIGHFLYNCWLRFWRWKRKFRKIL